ncbi:5-oxoprolinase subunit C family protein [Microbacterium halophytorum]|uniref:5-oxoprolinase subunit C family protein n=1 Tax=Microbacterium halophytorum TaxID=2067568 RepID=UPI000CFB8DC2|nr:biotin-dependent carboxyltransferase family protein [Microbacterium halophytorum]
MTASIRITEAGRAAVTDLGRHRGPGVGLPVNGALDQYSARAANILVANAEGAPLIEALAFDIAFVPSHDVLIAVTGADMLVTVDGVERPMWEPVPVEAGQEVRLGDMLGGMRTYIAVRGGFDVPELLGSCAPDPAIGFGTTLAVGDSIGLHARTGVPVNPYFGISLFNFGVDRPYFGDTACIDVTDGPDIDEFAGTAGLLFEAPYRVSTRSNQVGLRLSGVLPTRVGSGEMISRGVPVGAIEVPPGGELLVLHRGRGVTAGYPVLGVVTSTSLDTLGQVRPETEVSFRRVSLERAARDARVWRERLDRLRDRVGTVFSCLGVTPAGMERAES